jgi:hypothetical protein
MAHQDVSQLVLLKQLVVDWQNSTAGIPEDDINALIKQGLDDDLCSTKTPLSHRFNLSPHRRSASQTKLCP